MAANIRTAVNELTIQLPVDFRDARGRLPITAEIPAFVRECRGGGSAGPGRVIRGPASGVNMRRSGAIGWILRNATVP
jgi:hypothetical protein